MELITLLKHETKTLIKETLTDETKTIQVMPQGNALLCHAFYRSGSGNVSLNFYQFTTGKDLNERTVIGSINLTEFSTAAKPITLLSIHDRVMMEVVVSGTVEIGVLATVVDQFAVDVEIDLESIDVAASQQFLEGHVFDVAVDKTNISSGIDVDSGVVEAQRIKNSRLLVDSDFSARYSGRVTEVSLNNTTWTALPSTALTGRRAICVQNSSSANIKVNYDNAQVGFVGMLIKKNHERSYDLKDNVILYGKSEEASAVVNVEEIS